jgi:hypothetical protein
MANIGRDDQVRVLQGGRETALGGSRKHVGEDIEIIAVEQHAGADQQENPVVE